MAEGAVDSQCVDAEIQGRIGAYGQVIDRVGAVDTVSYTHLRAHETVLDLVCRLLLDNKKTERG